MSLPTEAETMQTIADQRDALLAAAKEGLYILEILTVGYKHENLLKVMQSLREAIQKAKA